MTLEGTSHLWPGDDKHDDKSHTLERVKWVGKMILKCEWHQEPLQPALDFRLYEDNKQMVKPLIFVFLLHKAKLSPHWYTVTVFLGGHDKIQESTEHAIEFDAE